MIFGGCIVVICGFWRSFRLRSDVGAIALRPLYVVDQDACTIDCCVRFTNKRRPDRAAVCLLNQINNLQIIVFDHIIEIVVQIIVVRHRLRCRRTADRVVDQLIIIENR